jgi:hypothetical protein
MKNKLFNIKTKIKKTKIKLNKKLKIKSIIILAVLCLLQLVIVKDVTAQIYNAKSDLTKLNGKNQDTLSNNEFANEDVKTSSGAASKYKSYQDSIFQHFLNMKVTALTLFHFNLSLSDEEWATITKSNSDLPYQAALKSLAVVPPSAFIPSGQEQVLYESNLEAAQYIPFVSQPRYGLKIPFHDIGQFLGLIEDTSPDIYYSIDSPEYIQVVIYSLQGIVVATIYDGKQAPGNYKITWNFRDDNGRRMLAGDYIGEVRIGNSKFLRKRIVVP